MLSYKKHYPPCPPRQRRTSVARKNSGDYRRDCHTIPTINEIFRTIPLAFRNANVCMRLYAFTSALSLAFRKVSVCVCLYGLGIALSHWSFRRGASSLLPLHQPLPFPQPSQKNDNPLASHHILASLVKGRWIDGKAQTVVLLRFNCDTSAFLFTKLLCRQDGRIALHPPSLSIPTTFSKAHQPLRPAPSPLPYERSVGFASLRNSGRSTSGIHARPLSKVRCCRPKKFGRLPEGLPHHHPSLAPTLPKPHYPTHFS